MTLSTVKRQSPFSDHLGFEVLEQERNFVVVAATIQPQHRNSSGIPHGGFISSLIDMSCGLAGLFPKQATDSPQALTLSLSIQFIDQAQGDLLRSVAKVTRAGSNIFYATADVYDGENNHIASGQAVCRYRSTTKQRL